MAENNEGKFQTLDVPIVKLSLDDNNPRLPEDFEESLQEELIEYVAEEYDSISIASSIASHGYFRSEPLIALPADDGSYCVVEGNRRLAALKILVDDDLRSTLSLSDMDRWNELSDLVGDIDTVPVMVVPNRKSVAPIIGYRHISGIEPWDPWAKARFIANLLEEEELSFDDAATQVGESSNDIRASYRNYRVLREGNGIHGISTDRAERRFGVFTRAMSSLPLRTHIGVPAPSEVELGENLVSAERTNDLSELLSWLFGTDDLAPVIGESRDISRLGTIVDSEHGLEVLRETRNLDDAYIAAGGLRDRLLSRLNRAYTNLDAASEDIHDYATEDDVGAILEKCQKALDFLFESVRWVEEHAEDDNED